MDKALFYSILNNPNLLDSGNIKEIEQLCKDFPVFLPSSFLYLRELKNNKSVYFDKQLKEIALKSPNRVLLNDFLNKEFTDEVVDEISIARKVNPEESKVTSEELNTAITEPESKEEKINDLEADILNHAIHSSISLEVSPYVLEDIKEEENKSPNNEIPEETTQIESLEPPKESEFKTNDLYSWLESVSFTGLTDKPKPPTPKKKEKIEKVDRSDLIEKFIQEEPRIKVKKDFYNPSDMAKKSVLDDNELVTETLAKIYADQGNYSKAIKAYDKLSLKYPEKSTYFAAQIKELEQQLKQK